MRLPDAECHGRACGQAKEGESIRREGGWPESGRERDREEDAGRGRERIIDGGKGKRERERERRERERERDRVQSDTREGRE